MYWEETIELIKEYANEPLASFPYPFADSDDLDKDPGYEVYEYERGTVKTKYIPIENFPEKIKKTIERYFKYELYNIKYSFFHLMRIFLNCLVNFFIYRRNHISEKGRAL